MFVNQFLSQAKLRTVQAIILRQFYRRLKPELGFPVSAVYVPREHVVPVMFVQLEIGTATSARVPDG